MANELTADFVDEVKAGLSQRDPVQRRLILASYEVDDSREHFFAAIKAAAPHMREVLASIMAHGPGEDDPGAPVGQRARAAYWFLWGFNAGCWTATPQETETARILIAIGGFAMPEKTKADLAREVGLPTEDMVFVKPVAKPAKAPKAKAAAMTKDERNRWIAVSRECALMQATVKDPAATDGAKIEAVERYFRMMACLAPGEFNTALPKAWATACTNYVNQGEKL